jgi:hypothetical protein
MDDATAQEMARLRRRVEELERHLDLPTVLDADRRPVPDTWLLSESFLKRAFGVLGHYLVASLIIAVPFYLLLFLFALALGGFGAFAGGAP